MLKGIASTVTGLNQIKYLLIINNIQQLLMHNNFFKKKT